MMDDLFLTFDNESIFKPLGFVERAVATDRVSTIGSIAHADDHYVILCASYKTADLFLLRDDNWEKREVKAKAEDEGSVLALHD